jgi:hypothetical protein
MKAILKFNLPEEQEEFEIANKGWKFRSALSEYDNYLRGKIKYDENLTDEQYKVYDEVRTKLWEILNEDQLTLD